MTGRPDRHGAAAGFTLIELVVALAVAGVVSLLLLEGIRLATTGLDRLSQKAEQLDARRGLDITLRNALGAAAPIPAPDGEASFVGQPTRLSFLTLAEDGGAGLYRIQIGLDEARKDRPLIFNRRLADSSGERRGERGILATSVRRFRIAYFGSDTVGTEPAWHDRWEGLGYLPKLVRFVIEGTDGTARPPIVVRVWNAG